MLFANRKDAGIKLAMKLQGYADENNVIYALPRGGVELGYEIAAALKAPLDVVITRKIGHPSSPEYAVCSVTENGELICDEHVRHELDSKWLEGAVRKERNEAMRRRTVYLKSITHLSPRNKTAIIVDDGVATGLTMHAAIRSIRARHPKKIVVAVPVCPRDTAKLLRAEVDDLVLLEDAVDYLGAVGAYYDDFSQVSDATVIELLKRSRFG